MADADAVRGTGLPERLPTDPAPGGAAPAPADQAMTLVDHLSELRTRLVRSILAVLIGTGVGFFAAQTVRRVLVMPLPADQRVLQVLGPGDAFAVTFRIAVVVGIILAMPVLLYQLWAFVAPGLTQGERRALRPWIPLALFFFALGVTVAWVILPFAVGFLLSFTDETLVANLTAPAYFDFVTTMFLAFGLLMEFPIVLYGLARAGIVSSARLRASWRIALLAMAIFAAIATPGGDLISPLVLGGTMFLLYLLTIFAIKRSGR